MNTKRLKIVFIASIVALLLLFVSAPYEVTRASTYGSGIYGDCPYGEGCNISLSTSGSVAINVSPTPSGVYTFADDEVEVTTNSADGYSLTIATDSPTENSLQGSTDAINASSGTTASPASLGLNEWGFRIDGYDGFGAGPTTALENQSSTALTFAGVPTLGSESTIKSTSSSAPTGDITELWYGVRVDSTTESGIYTATVLYTAVNL